MKMNKQMYFEMKMRNCLMNEIKTTYILRLCKYDGFYFTILTTCWET